MDLAESGWRARAPSERLGCRCTWPALGVGNVTRVVARAARIAYRSNITGLAAMVAYSALMALVPLVLLSLFAVSIALESQSARAGLLVDLERVFPAAARGTLVDALTSIQTAKVSLGVGALLGSAWAGISLWSALDTAFRVIYAYPGRSWLEQKRWAARMLALALGLVIALLGVPVLHSVAVGGAGALPLGLSSAGIVAVIGGLVISHLTLFLALCAVYHLVPRGRAPWSATWPGALVALGLLTLVSLVFPLYLGQVSSLAHAGAVFSFVVVVLLWFYAMTLALLLGGCVNASRQQSTRAGEDSASAPSPEMPAGAALATPSRPGRPGR